MAMLGAVSARWRLGAPAARRLLFPFLFFVLLLPPLSASPPDVEVSLRTNASTLASVGAPSNACSRHESARLGCR